MPVIPQTSSPPCGIISFAIPQGPPNCGHGDQLPAGGTIGDLFRDYGEEYPVRFATGQASGCTALTAAR